MQQSITGLNDAWQFALRSSSLNATGRHERDAYAITLASSASNTTTTLSSSDISSGNDRGHEALGLPERHISQHSLHLSELASRESHVGSNDDVEDDPWQWPFLAPRLSPVPLISSSSRNIDVRSSFVLPSHASYRSTPSSRPPLRASTSSEETTTNDAASGKRGCDQAKNSNGKPPERALSPSRAAGVALLPSLSHRRSESFLDLGGGVSPTMPASRLSIAFTATSSEHETSIYGQKGIQVQIEDLSMDVDRSESVLEKRRSTAAKRESVAESTAMAEQQDARTMFVHVDQASGHNDVCVRCTCSKTRSQSANVEELRKAVAFYQRDCMEATKDCAYWQSAYLLLLKQCRETEDLANQLKAHVQVMERRERRLMIMQQLKSTAHVGGDVLQHEGKMNILAAIPAGIDRRKDVKDELLRNERAAMAEAVSPNKATLPPESPLRRSPMVFGRRRSSSCVLTNAPVQQRMVDSSRQSVVDLGHENDEHTRDGNIAQWILDARVAVAKQASTHFRRQEDDPLSPVSPGTRPLPPTLQQYQSSQIATRKNLRHPFSTTRSEPSIADMDEKQGHLSPQRQDPAPQALRDSTYSTARTKKASDYSTTQRDGDTEPIIDFHGFDVRATLPPSLSQLLATSTSSREHKAMRSKGRHPFANLAYNAKR